MLLIFQYILIYITNLALIFCGTAKQGEAYELFLQGEYEILQNNFSKAEKHYSRALSLVPDSPTILKSLVDLKSYQGEYADAIQYLEQKRIKVVLGHLIALLLILMMDLDLTIL